MIVDTLCIDKASLLICPHPFPFQHFATWSRWDSAASSSWCRWPAPQTVGQFSLGQPLVESELVIFSSKIFFSFALPSIFPPPRPQAFSHLPPILLDGQPAISARQKLNPAGNVNTNLWFEMVFKSKPVLVHFVKKINSFMSLNLQPILPPVGQLDKCCAFSKTGCSYITVNLTVSTDWSKGLSQHGCQPKIFPKVKEKENSKHPIQNKHGSPKRMLPSSLSILSRHTWLGRLVGGSILMEGSHSPGGSTVTCVMHIIIHCWPNYDI